MPRIRNADYERIADNISAKKGDFKLYLVAAEGDKTEAIYFQAIKNLFKNANNSSVHVEFIDRTQEDAGKSEPKYVHKTIIDMETWLQKKGYQITERDELWIIVDVDDYDNRKNSFETLMKACEKKTYFNMALSNPCFEIWLILHYEKADILQSFVISEKFMRKRPSLCKTRWKQLKTPNKSDKEIFESLFEQTPIAIERAKQLQPCKIDKQHLEKHICTDVYKLLEKLYKILNS
ncbi:RloB family protein [Candidatus Albibeggiatoa sp. nov. NOAA]|uniref:RloB family protein n=1 Tax=Candidatus Albibeggiatoa sp. nov. NOAA TaxID=3162724 RepID=UPI0033010254|nr:RloB family protein [Thiotrichaceae bacterium]